MRVEVAGSGFEEGVDLRADVLDYRYDAGPDGRYDHGRAGVLHREEVRAEGLDLIDPRREEASRERSARADGHEANALPPAIPMPRKLEGRVVDDDGRERARLGRT